MAILSILMFTLLIVTFTWNSEVNLDPIGKVTALEVSRGGMNGVQSVSFDERGKITATKTTYGDNGATQSKTGALTDQDRTEIIAATLQKYNALELKSDGTPPPDAETSTLLFTIDGKKYELRCVQSGSDCTKLVDALFENFATILSR